MSIMNTTKNTRLSKIPSHQRPLTTVLEACQNIQSSNCVRLPGQKLSPTCHPLLRPPRSQLPPAKPWSTGRSRGKISPHFFLGGWKIVLAPKTCPPSGPAPLRPGGCCRLGILGGLFRPTSPSTAFSFCVAGPIVILLLPDQPLLLCGQTTLLHHLSPCSLSLRSMAGEGRVDPAGSHRRSVGLRESLQRPRRMVLPAVLDVQSRSMSSAC